MNYSNPRYKYKRENFIKYLNTTAKYTANKRGISYNLTEDEIKSKFTEQKYKCFYTGIKFDFLNNGNYYPSIDRLDSSKGYVFSNIVICIQKLNLMKHTLELEEFIYFCKKVANNKNLKKKN